MFVDEFYFHHKRGLPLWERLGHPIDTISVALCYGIILALPPTQENLLLYGGLCLFSCALITKDEFVHQQHCAGGESWLHSILFILHPLVFIVAGLIWYDHGMAVDSNPNLWLSLRALMGSTILFLVYQIVYWSFAWKTDRK